MVCVISEEHVGAFVLLSNTRLWWCSLSYSLALVQGRDQLMLLNKSEILCSFDLNLGRISLVQWNSSSVYIPLILYHLYQWRSTYRPALKLEDAAVIALRHDHSISSCISFPDLLGLLA